VAVGLQSSTDKLLKKTPRRKSAAPVQELSEEAAVPVAPHVVGKPAEREPDENAYRPHEEPEAAAQSAEALDAGVARCTEFSDFANRGRDRS